MKLEIELDDEKIEKLIKITESLGLSTDRINFIKQLEEMFTKSCDKSLDVLYQSVLLMKSGAASLEELQQKLAEASTILGIDI